MSAERTLPSGPHHNETARGHVVAAVPLGPSELTAGNMRARLTRERFDLVELVVVITGDGRYLGAVPVGDVLSEPADTRLGDLVRRDWPSIGADVDQERAVETAASAGVATLPVVDGDGRPLGCIPAHTLLEVLAAEHREDVHRMAGILRERADRRHALEDPPLRRFTRRLPWLIVGLALSAAGTGVMAGFEETMKRNVTVAFFIPALVYLTDAIGTQTEAIAVRGLAAARGSFLGLLMGEIATGSLIGAALGALAVVGIWAVFGDVRLALAVGLSLLIAGCLASAIGLTLPWALSRLGIDPALGSGPVATIVQDVLTLIVYFAIVTSLLPQP